MPENADMYLIGFCTHLNRKKKRKARCRFSSNKALHQEGCFSYFIQILSSLLAANALAALQYGEFS